ncbi:hypothetical protein ACS0TY_006300 [Phlomoides rotata]
MRFWPTALLMKLVSGKRNRHLSVNSFLISYPKQSRSNCCLREIHTAMSRLRKSKLRKCLFKWLRLSWRRGSKLVNTWVNSKGSLIFLGTSVISSAFIDL